MLTIKNLTKHYFDDLKRTQKTAIKDLSIEFHTSKTTAILGHNGAGKTTLIRMILGLAFPTHGSILLDGRPIGLKDRQRLGYLPEADHLNLQLTPREILTHHLQLFRPLHPRIKDTVQSTLIKTDLIHHADRKANLLSKGQRRRVAWSQSMIHDPDILILDEPFSGLDPHGRSDMSRWIHEAKTHNKTIILCTHDTKLAHVLCDHCLIMQSGFCIWDSSRYTQKHYVLELQDLPKGSLPSPLHRTQNGSHHTYVWDCSSDAYTWLNACQLQNIDIQSFTVDKLPLDYGEKSYFKPKESLL
ncbi:MAG: ABC transporter ATP-binding protein [Oligoflexales bacterium]